MSLKQKPRLDRRNAIKNIDYHASISVSPSSSSSSFDTQPVQKTRSLDLSRLSDRTSFRIEGIDGEFDVICRSLGLSGPEDFAIPAAAWEARKAPSPSKLSFSSNSVKASPGSELSERIGAKVSVSNGTEGGIDRRELTNGIGLGKTQTSVLYGNEVKHEDTALGVENSELRNGVCLAETVNRVEEESTSTMPVRGYRDGESGIKGVGPPVLAPPPVKSRSVVHDLSSTWEIFRDFAPPDDGDLGSPAQVGVIGSPDEVDGGSDGELEPNEMTASSGSSRVLSETSSDTSNDDNHDNDSFSPLAEIVGSFSPDRSFRHISNNWQKGDFLGSGSFGTVYEGYTE